jgi:hypothetical protein
VYGLKEGEVELAGQLVLEDLLIVEGETLCVCPATGVEERGRGSVRFKK